MATAVLAIVAIILLAIGAPVGICLGLGMVATVIGGFNVTTLTFIAQQMYSGFESLPLVAIPCFMLAGSLMLQRYWHVCSLARSQALVRRLPRRWAAS